MARFLIVDDTDEARARLRRGEIAFVESSAEGATVESLRDSQQRFVKAFRVSPVAMTITRLRDLVITEANDAYYRIFETSPEDSLGRTPVELGLTSEAALHGLRDALLAHGSIGGLELTVHTRRGRPLHVAVASELLEVGGERYSLTSMQDITEWRATEAALRESAERLNLAVRVANVGIWDWNIRNSRLVLSREWKSQLGYEEHEIGDDFGEWERRVHPDDLPETNARLARHLANPVGAHEVEFRMRHKDGSWRWIHARGEAFLGADGKPERMLGCHIDITARKRAEVSLRESEEQLRHAQRMESVGRLASGIAHDFNNVLTVINGLADLGMNSLPEGTPLRADLATILSAGEHAAKLTAQLLAFSRKQVLRPQAVDLNALVNETRALLLRVLGSDVRVETRFGPGLAQVRVDPSQLQQVILNLAVNSRDAMPDGGTLLITTRNVHVDADSMPAGTDLRPGRYVQVAVADTGTGMDDATRRHVFEPFFTTKEPGRGTGLGLATVHGIVKQSGGDVVVASELGAGTTFSIYLPVTLDEVPLQAPLPRAALLEGGAECVLVVDDNESVLRLTQRILEWAGYRVLSADSGAGALELLEANGSQVHLLLADVVMHGMRGTELVEHVIKRWPLIKVLLMSGYPDGADHRRGVLESGVELIPKPFTPDQLAARVRAVLDR